MKVLDTGASVGTNAYSIVAQHSTFYVNADNTTTPIEQITARSLTYGVEFTFNVTKATYDSNGGPVLASERTAQVDELLAHPHVQGAYPEQDQDNSGRLVNFLVFIVGTDDQVRTVTTRVAMDHLGTPGAFAALDAAWKQIVALGPITAAVPG